MKTKATEAPSIWGRGFFHPLVDYAVIGGGLSLAAAAAVWLSGPFEPSSESLWLPLAVLFANGAHFAASTVRLYTKPGAFQDHPFLTMGLPVVSLLVLVVCVRYSETLGYYLNRLYLTWSPYHYATQTYGLAVIYAFRSGIALTKTERRWLRGCALLPFLFAFLYGVYSDTGLAWFIPATWALKSPLLSSYVDSLSRGLAILSLLGPLGLYGHRAYRRQKPLPLIVGLLLLVNAIWWVGLSYLQAFVLATIFHGLQYLGVTLAFDGKDQGGPSLSRGLKFYALCLVLGYLMFHCWPLGFQRFDYGHAESVLVVVACVNLHHFIVDAFIWKVRPRTGA